MNKELENFTTNDLKKEIDARYVAEQEKKQQEDAKNFINTSRHELIGDGTLTEEEAKKCSDEIIKTLIDKNAAIRYLDKKSDEMSEKYHKAMTFITSLPKRFRKRFFK